MKLCYNGIFCILLFNLSTLYLLSKVISIKITKASWYNKRFYCIYEIVISEYLVPLHFTIEYTTHDSLLYYDISFLGNLFLRVTISNFATFCKITVKKKID